MGSPSSTSQPQKGRKGAQEPRIRIEPSGLPYTDADDAAELMRLNSIELYPWQYVPLRAWLARDDDDQLVYLTCGLSVPRQNGKNVVIEAREVYELVACGGHILHTAHRVKTAKKSFKRLVRFFKDDKRNPEAAAMVENIRYTNGEEAIYLKNGGYIEYASRGRGTSRGFDDITLVVFDEAQDLTDDQLDAIMFTLAASSSGDRQIIYTGTPPDASAPGEVFTRVRNSTLDNNPPRNCWHEWSVKEIGDVWDVDRWYETNPSLGYILDYDFTFNECANAAPDGFAHERLGWWSPQAVAKRVISDKNWENSLIKEIGNDYPYKSSMAVKFSMDGSRYTLAGCKTKKSGEAAVELIEIGTTENGTKSLARELYERRRTVCSIVIDGLSGADSLDKNLQELNAPRGYVMRPSPGQVIAAATGFLDSLADGSLKHTRQSQLDDSAKNAVKRTIGHRGGWGFGCEEPYDETPIEAVALALWGVRNTKRNPRRKQRLI